MSIKRMILGVSSARYWEYHSYGTAGIPRQANVQQP